MPNQNLLEIFKKYLESERLRESTGTLSSGSYKMPLGPGLRIWDKNTNQPFTEKLSGFDNAELYVDSLDGNIDTKDVEQKERKSRKISNYQKKHPIQNDDDGDILNNGKTKPIKNVSKPYVSEADSSVTAGSYTGPIEIGLKKWRKQELGPFIEFSDHPANKKKKQKTLKNNIKKSIGVWEKHPEDGYEIPKHDAHTINEDLGVWFGTKKKPKGSKQPKGPWVNICRKKEGGGHPPCGRPEADSKGYPKCRAAGVAAKMTDSQKKAACQQKRRKEKKNPKSGTGNSPTMTSYKPKKKNESVLKKTILEILRKK
jgi:hypothetical protein